MDQPIIVSPDAETTYDTTLEPAEEQCTDGQPVCDSSQPHTNRKPRRGRQTMASKKREQMRLSIRNGVTVVELGEMEIWDGADLALLRETLTKLIEKDGCQAVGIEMSFVKYIPSGFFGMLCDWHERGNQMYLYSPQPNVSRMLWFRRFFEHSGADGFVLTLKRHEAETTVETLDWGPNSHWTDVDMDIEETPESVQTIDAPSANGNGHLSATNGHSESTTTSSGFVRFTPEDLEKIRAE